MRNPIAILCMLAAVAITGNAQINSCFFSGNWNDPETWDLGHVPLASEDVFIASAATCVLDVNTEAIRDLSIDGALRGSGESPHYVTMTGDILCNGSIGTGGTDSIGFNTEGAACAILGTGSFGAMVIRKTTIGTSTNLIINLDVTLFSSGTALYNDIFGASFNVRVSQGKILAVPNGSVSIDGPDGATGPADGGDGTFTVAGTLIIGNTLYLTTDNLEGACSVVIENGGVLRCANAVCTASGGATLSFLLSTGGTLDFTSGGWGVVSSVNNTFTLDGMSIFSAAGAQAVKGPPVKYFDLTLTGSGPKNLDEVTISDTLSIQEAATTVNSPFYEPLAALEYAGSSAQAGSPFRELFGAKCVVINNPSGVTLTGDASVENGLTMLRGNLNTGAFTMNIGADATLFEEHEGSSVVGALAVQRDVAALSAQNFGGIGLSLDGNSDPVSLPAVTVTRITGDGGVVAIGPNSGIKRKFSISGGGTVARNLTFTWFPSEDNGKDSTQMNLWENQGFWSIVGTSSSVSGSPRSMTRPITSFSGTFTATDNLNALPIELLSFTATPAPGGVLLSWSTLSETNNYGFFAWRRQENQQQFTEVPGSFVPGHGTTIQPQFYSYADTTVTSGVWYYRLKQMDLDGAVHFSDPVRVDILSGVEENIPRGFSLSQNYPNPFNPVTRITFSVEHPGHTILSVYNLLGQRVATLFEGDARPEQVYIAAFGGENLVSGVYYYVLESAGHRSVKRMILLK